MQALILDGDSEAPCVRLAEIAPPRAEAGRLIIAVEAAGVTRMEPHWATGWVDADGSKRTGPIALGHEVAGRVLSRADDVSAFEIGQRVLGVIEPERSGAMAERVSASPAQLIAAPDALASDVASTLPLAGLTAWQGIIRHGTTSAGNRVLIHGGAGAVGSYAIQLAKWAGAHVIATARGADADFCRSLGADIVIDFEHERFEEQVSDIDLVFDPIGGEVQDRSWGTLKRGGRLITIAGEAGDEPDQARAGSLGVHARWFLFEFNETELKRLVELVLEGEIRPVINERFRLNDVAQAFSKHYAPRPGKAVLLLD